MIVSSRQVVVDEKMMMDLLGANYTMDEIREETSAQPSSEEVPMVQPLVQQLYIPKTTHEHVHSPPKFDHKLLKG
jgi:hypothetical protein